MRDTTTRDGRAMRKAAPTCFPTAASRTCKIPELLEMILLKCYPAEIIRARQINSFFKHLIDRSKSLRYAIFLEQDIGKLYRSQSLHPIFGRPARIFYRKGCVGGGYSHIRRRTSIDALASRTLGRCVV
ncbi:uncharacterized protein RCC_01648 [Ramularia collo-cygni]|uniref:F-box domain-containing protein n=1 Tax=Ramularia collo-cygni TaxID=112498 RepID=A0A2D3V026_9PEZI|nr:uncharacterized protein RCC_01648 [Ramularia collo-cygni]CZT15814.1 uncharacterized protein RCC_01648 [Ramularia collo-cygni]